MLPRLKCLCLSEIMNDSDSNLVEDEVTHFLIVFRSTIIRKAIHKSVHGDVVTSTSSKKFFPKNIFLVEENDHRCV
jgi:hypothetical protein